MILNLLKKIYGLIKTIFLFMLFGQTQGIKFGIAERIFNNNYLHTMKKKLKDYDLPKIFPFNNYFRLAIFISLRLTIAETFFNLLLLVTGISSYLQEINNELFIERVICCLQQRIVYENRLSLILLIICLIMARIFFVFITKLIFFYELNKKCSLLKLFSGSTLFLFISTILHINLNPLTRVTPLFLVMWISDIIAYFFLTIFADQLLIRLFEIKDETYNKMEDFLILNRKYQEKKYGLKLKEILKECYSKGQFDITKISVPEKDSEFYDFITNLKSFLKA